MVPTPFRPPAKRFRLIEYPYRGSGYTFVCKQGKQRSDKADKVKEFTLDKDEKETDEGEGEEAEEEERRRRGRRRREEKNEKEDEDEEEIRVGISRERVRAHAAEIAQRISDPSFVCKHRVECLARIHYLNGPFNTLRDKNFFPSPLSFEKKGSGLG